MKRFQTLLLDIWREACRHIELAEAVARMMPRLRQQLPIDALWVRQFDAAAGTVETIVVGRAESGNVAYDRCEISPAAFARLRAWARSGKLLRGEAGVLARRWPGLLPEAVTGMVAVGPLRGHGALVLGGELTAEHEPMVAALCEPFAVAVDNDRRVHELQALREAAEADKHSLLRRIGREDLSDQPIIGAEGGLRQVMQRIELVSKSDAAVLILGETGSGKEVVARALHSRSARRDRPFVRVNCGAIPHELIDSELFGHEKGAFTGATARRQGWFERADGGVLLLDEVGELTAAAQVRLLRVLQDGVFERVGGEKPVHVDVRLITATHQDLPQMVRDGRFREDLWYRIAVFPIVLPSLRERREDIADLAEHFARRAGRRFGLAYCPPSERDLALLRDYDWPGNVRELAAVIDRAAILGDGRTLEVAIALGAPSDVAKAPALIAQPSAAPASLEEALVHHIEAALRRTLGRVDGPHGAARLLRINANTLRSRMRKHSIDPRKFRQAHE